MSALKYFFGVVARPQTWLDYVYLWLAFPLGLFYFIFLVVGLSVGLSLVIVWVGIPMLLLVAGAWYLFAGFERILARELLRVPVAPAPRAWEAADGVWNKLKAHFAAAATWKDLVYLLARLPLGIVSFTIVMTQAGLVVSFIGAPLFQRFDALWIGGQRIESPGVAFALVPVGVLVVIALFHVVHGWAWVCGKLATALFGDPRLVPAVAPAGPHAGAAQPPQGTQYPQPPQSTPYPQPPTYPQSGQYPQAPQPPQHPQAPPYAQPPQYPQAPQAQQQMPGAEYPQQAQPTQWTAGPPPHLPPGLKYPAGTQWPQPPLAAQQPQGTQGPSTSPTEQGAPGEPATSTTGSSQTPTPDASAATAPAPDAAPDGAPACDIPTPDPQAPDAPSPDESARPQ